MRVVCWQTKVSGIPGIFCASSFLGFVNGGAGRIFRFASTGEMKGDVKMVFEGFVKGGIVVGVVVFSCFFGMLRFGDFVRFTFGTRFYGGVVLMKIEFFV